MTIETFENRRFQYVCITIPDMDDVRVLRYRRARYRRWRGRRLEWVLDQEWVTRHYPTFEAAREAARGLAAEDGE